MCSGAFLITFLYKKKGLGPLRGYNVCGSELGAAETACRPQSPLQQAMLLGHSASVPFLGVGLHWWHGLPSVHFAGAAPLRAGFVTGSAGRRRAPL